MIADAVTEEAVPVRCFQSDCVKNIDKGVMFRVTLSRLEEGLGHEGFKCDKCGHTIKRVPKGSA